MFIRSLILFSFIVSFNSLADDLTKHYKFKYTTRADDSLIRIVRKFIKKEARIDFDDPSLIKTRNRNFFIQDWYDLPADTEILLYLPRNRTDIRKLKRYFNEISAKKLRTKDRVELEYLMTSGDYEESSTDQDITTPEVSLFGLGLGFKKKVERNDESFLFFKGFMRGYLPSDPPGHSFSPMLELEGIMALDEYWVDFSPFVSTVIEKFDYISNFNGLKEVRTSTLYGVNLGADFQMGDDYFLFTLSPHFGITPLIADNVSGSFGINGGVSMDVFFKRWFFSTIKIDAKRIWADNIESSTYLKFALRLGVRY